jgi:hypothetical protein
VFQLSRYHLPPYNPLRDDLHRPCDTQSPGQ